MNSANTEILQIADSVAREKNISKEIVLDAMERAIEAAGKKKYGNEHDIKVDIDKKTGEIKIYRVRKVMNEIENPLSEVSLYDAQLINSKITVGEKIYEALPSIDLGRVTAQAAKQIIFQKIWEAEREKQYNDFKDRVGEIINGLVKRADSKKIEVDLGKAEGVLYRTELIGGEIYKNGDRIRVYVKQVQRDDKNPQVILSRTDNNFLAMLFKQEVPEVYDNLIEIKSVARDAGSRAKIAVYTEDSSIDAVGSCVGIRGTRVQSVINELKGEKIDIVLWSSDPAKFVVSALSPAEVSKVVIDQERRKVGVVVPTDNLSIAIGRRGQNVRLASQLTGWGIEVLTEDEESKKRLEEFNLLSKKFMNELKIEEMMANFLAAEGFTTTEEIAYTDIEDLADIKGFDKDIASELKDRALAFLERLDENYVQELKRLGVDSKLVEVLGISNRLAVSLAEIGCKTLEDLAEISLAEIKEELKDHQLTEVQLSNLISKSQKLVNNK